MIEHDDFLVKEGKGEKPIGVHPNPIIKKALENLYVSIVGVIDLGDLTSFINSSADLTYSEARDKMIREYGTPAELSHARLKAMTEEAASKLEVAEQEALAEQKTFEQDFTELDEIARKRLGENLELSRKNEELEREIKQLKEALAGEEKVPPITTAPPAAHGSMYHEYRKRISEVFTIAGVTDLAAEIFDITEHGEYDKLTKSDITELLEELRKTGERRALKLAEMKLEKPKIRGLPEIGKEEVLLPRKRERREVPAFPIPSGIPQISYKYTTADRETFTSMGEEFIRDFELERTIKLNRLLLFPDHWYTLSPWGKREVYGWDMGSAFREAVLHLHKFSWESLQRDFGIPAEYIKVWRATQ